VGFFFPVLPAALLFVTSASRCICHPIFEKIRPLKKGLYNVKGNNLFHQTHENPEDPEVWDF